MSAKKHTLTTLAMALSVLLASCSSNSGTPYHNNTPSTDGTVPNTSPKSVGNDSHNSNKDYTVDPNTVKLPVKDINDINTLSFNNNQPYNVGYRLLSSTNLPPFPKIVFFSSGDYLEYGDSIDKTDDDVKRASLSFNGVSDYNTLKALWGTPIAGINPATALLPSYSIGLGTVLGNNSKNFIPTVISQQAAPVNDNNADYKTDLTNGKVVSTALSTDHVFTGEGIAIGLVSNSFKVTSDNNTTFTHPIKTVDLDPKATIEHQTELAAKHNLGALHTNAFIPGALITGNRNYQANGLVPNAQLYVSTINSDDIIAKKFPPNVFANLYKASHPVAIISDGINTGLYSSPDSVSTQDNLINSTDQAISNLQELATNDQPLLIIPTSEYNIENPYNGSGKAGNPYTSFVASEIDDNGNKVESKGSSRVDENDGLNKLYNEYILDTNGYPILLVNGAYFDPKGIYTEAQQKYKVKIINHRDIDATKDAPSSDQAIPDLVTNFKGQPITTDAMTRNTVNHRTNFVNAYGMLSCAEAAYFCLTAPADYTSNLINRPNSAKDSSNIADQIFPVSDTDQRFKHTDFSVTYAAARVAAATAILKQQFPWFSAQNLRVTLLTTATPIGPYRISSEYGWGVLNIDNALAGPSQFIFGDFYVDFTNIGTNDFKKLVNYDNQHKTRSTYNFRSYFTHNISGAGGLFVLGRKDDYLILTGSNTYTGSTYVYDTNLVIAKSKNFTPPSTPSSAQTKLAIATGNVATTGSVGLLQSPVFISPNATLTGIDATFGEKIINDGVASFKDSVIACSISGEGTVAISGGTIGHKPNSTTDYCKSEASFEGIDNADAYNGVANPSQPVIQLTSSLDNPGHQSSLTLNHTEVFGSVLGDVPKVTVVDTTIHGNLSTYNPKDLEPDEYKFTDLTIVNSTVTDNLVVAGNTTIIDSNIGSISGQVTTLFENMTVANSTFNNLVMPINSTFYFDPSAEPSYVKEKLTLGGRVEAIAQSKQMHKEFVPSNGKTYTLFKAHTIIGNFDSVEVDSSQKLIGYSVEVEDNASDSNYQQVLVAHAHPIKAKEVINDLDDGFSPSDSGLMTASTPVVDSILTKADTIYNYKQAHHTISARDHNTLTLASDLQSFNADQLRTFLVKASAPIYSDLITANSVTLSNAYLDFSRKVNANYFSSLDNRKVKAYVSYSFLNNKFDTEFDQNSNANNNSVAGAHSYSTNLKATQLSNSVSAGAYGQFGYYNVGIGANYLHNDWKEKYADYEQVVANQQDLLMNLGQAKVDTATLMLSLAKTTGNYFLGTSIFGSYQIYNIDRSSLATLDQNAKFNSYGVTVNFNTGFRHFISTNSGFSGQASIAYNYNYHDKFSEQANSDLAKVLSYDIKAQGTSLAYANFLGQYFYNFSSFGFNQRLNLELGYTLNLFSTANQQITNSVTGVSLSSSNAFTGSNSNLLKFAAGYRVSLIKDLDLDLGVSYYTNNYWRVVKGTATLTYSF